MNSVTGENLMVPREPSRQRGLPLGFAAPARRRVSPCATAITVNGKRVDIPSYLVKPGDVVAVGEKFWRSSPIKEALISPPERF